MTNEQLMRLVLICLIDEKNETFMGYIAYMKSLNYWVVDQDLAASPLLPEIRGGGECGKGHLEGNWGLATLLNTLDFPRKMESFK